MCFSSKYVSVTQFKKHHHRVDKIFVISECRGVKSSNMAVVRISKVGATIT
jgi:hypothetical protein